MQRTVVFLALGLLCTTLLVSVVSVYFFRDVDRELVGRLNKAFASLVSEGVVFTLIIAGGVGLTTLLGRLVFRLRGGAPRASLGFLLGMFVVLGQYACDYAARRFAPQLSGAMLYAYLLIAILLCTAVILCDGMTQVR